MIDRNLMRSVRAAGWWFMFPKLLTHELKTHEAILMAALLNLDGMAPEGEEWFTATTLMLERQTLFSKTTIVRTLKDFESRGLIERRNTRTTPPIRQVRIDEHVLADMLLRGRRAYDKRFKVTDSDQDKVTDLGHRQTNGSGSPPLKGEKTETEEPTNGASVSGDLFDDDSPSADACQYGLLLKRVLAKSKRVKRLKSGDYSGFIQTLLNHNTPIGKISAVLNWLKYHSDDRFTPHIHNGFQFVEKFDALVIAMKREKEANPFKGVKASKRAKETAKRLIREHEFPAAVREVMPTLVQCFLNVRKSMRSALSDLDNKSTKYAGTIKWLNLSPDWLPRIDDWFTRFLDWEEWSGEPRTLIFNPNCKWFARRFEKTVREYVGETKAKPTASYILERIDRACDEAGRESGASRPDRDGHRQNRARKARRKVER